MNGVKVNITISLSVGIATSVTRMKSAAKTLSWLAPARLRTVFANHRKNPSSSRNIDITVIDRKSTRIFIGLIAASAVKPPKISSTSIRLNRTKSNAPNRGISQYVLIVMAFNFSFGLASAATITPRQLIAEIIMTGVIMSFSFISYEP